MCNDNRVHGESRLEEKSLQVAIAKGAKKKMIPALFVIRSLMY